MAKEKEELFITRIECNRCKTITNHSCFGEHKFIDRYDVDPNIWDEYTYQLLICRGCESATLRNRYTDSSFNLSITNGDYEYEDEFYPPRQINHIPEKRFIHIPQNILKIYRESIKAYNNDMFILCTAGLRTLMEGICKDKEVSGNNLKERIKNLKDFLPNNIIESLDSFRFMGNDAVHELIHPSTEDLKLAIEICQDLLNFLYDLDYKMKKLPRDKFTITSKDAILESDSKGDENNIRKA